MFPITPNFVPYSLPKPYLPELESLYKSANYNWDLDVFRFGVNTSIANGGSPNSNVLEPFFFVNKGPCKKKVSELEGTLN
jgi:hypothetical protein